MYRSDQDIPAADLEILQGPDNRPWLLGRGAFGAVGLGNSGASRARRVGFFWGVGGRLWMKSVTYRYWYLIIGDGP
jgi:hypothetical protein